MIIGITSGCFDLLHPMHVLYLNKCRKECDYLIVLIDSDMLISKTKPLPVFINELDRKYMVENLTSVGEVHIFNSNQEYVSLIKEMISKFSDVTKSPIKIFKRDYEIYGKPLTCVLGTENVIIPDVDRFSSTTQIKQHLINQNNKSC